MDEKSRIYAAIDLKSFYASVECVERGLDPLTTNLVVADESRTEKTICLAVSPSLKAYGIPGRARLFEVVQKVKEVNALRKSKLRNESFVESSIDSIVLSKHPEYELSYIAAVPRMSLYMNYSSKIYSIYLKYVAPEDIFAYSVDEVFIDLTDYGKLYKMSASELVRKMVRDVYTQTGITATAGVGTNMYLSKIAMDIWAKHTKPDSQGVRVAYLDERSYRSFLWDHKPITDFWRVGRGYAKKLEQYGMFTMGDVARCSLGKADEYHNEDLLFKLFGVNAGLLIDHAWGYEPCTMADVKNYRPMSNSISQGQVLHCAYTFDKTRLIVKEMVDILVLELVDKRLVTDQIVLSVGYDIANLTDASRRSQYRGEIVQDHYGRLIPKHAHGTVNLPEFTSSTSVIMKHVLELFDNIVDASLLTRRLNITANHVRDENSVPSVAGEYEQLDLFTDYEQQTKMQENKRIALEREKKIQHAIIDTKKKFGNNAIVKGMNLCDGGTAMERNRQIGGHRA